MPGLLETLKVLSSRHARSRWRDGREFLAMPDVTLDVSSLRAVSDEELRGVLGDADAAREWDTAIAERAERGIDIQIKGSSNLVDGRILFGLTRRFRPRRVLEVGTYMGAGTLSVAQALAANGDESEGVVTVDMRDVNSERGPWALYGASGSPRDNLAALGLGHLVEFILGSSLDYLPSHAGGFDLIFLDGDHRAQIVYREVPMALAALRPGGIILLHDFWREYDERDDVCYGPAMALDRLTALNPSLRVVTAREAGEAGSSIALLTRAGPE
ncbi:MAG: class I SAM-dependent methyltransferase [Planctomycetes bacterium]|nr:class I SAM-dependent methyltransferase [Planctomycetota bacterium]